MGTWGEELWDQWDNVKKQVDESTAEVEKFYLHFFQAREKVEREYAKGLRRLIKDYSPKQNKKDPEETSLKKEFRLLLEEIGFQAGQHELIEAAYGKNTANNIKKKVAEVRKSIEENRKKYNEIHKNMDKSYAQLTNGEKKYHNAHIAMETESNLYKSMEQNGDATRNAIERTRTSMDQKVQQCHEAKSTYAALVQTTNQEQEEHFTQQLPAVLNNMQDLYKENTNFIVGELRACISTEQERSPIIAKCHEQMIETLGKISAQADTEHVIEKLKTGNLPPEDFVYQEVPLGQDPKLLKVQVRRRATSTGGSTMSLNSISGVSPYQRLKEMNRKVEEQEKVVAKAAKEAGAIKTMVNAYTANPSLGDANALKKFQKELEVANQTLDKENSVLEGLKKERDGIDSAMGPGTLKRDPKPANLKIEEAQSFDYEALSPNGSEENYDSLTPNPPEFTFTSEGGGGGGPPPPPPPPGPSGPLAPPPPPSLPMASAMYDYQGEDGAMSMEVAERFIVLTRDADNTGWTEVEREGSGETGYLPTSYLQFL